MIFAPLGPHSEDPARADSQGRFKLSGLPARGNVWIVAVHPSLPLFAATEADPDLDFEVDMTLGALGAAVGSIVDSQGLPASEYKVGVARRRQGRGMMMWSGRLRERLGAHFSSSQTVTGDDGAWRVEGLVPGAEYDVDVQAPDARGGASTTFTAQPDETVDVGPVELGHWD